MSSLTTSDKRSESLKSYWKHVHEVSKRSGKSVAQVRHGFKGKAIPTKEGTHFTGRRYHYVARVKGTHHPKFATVASDTPLSETQIKNRMAKYFENKRDTEYDDKLYIEDGGQWNPDDFRYRPDLSSIDSTIELRKEAKGAYG